jgi:hypothetical protein
VIFDMFAYIIMEWTMPNESRICSMQTYANADANADADVCRRMLTEIVRVSTFISLSLS